MRRDPGYEPAWSSSVPIAASVIRPPGGGSWRSVSCSASTKTGSLVYCAIPLPRRNGRYARSRSRIRQPSIVVSSVSTIALQPHRSARETRLATSSFDVLQ